MLQDSRLEAGNPGQLTKRRTYGKIVALWTVLSPQRYG